MEAAIESTGPGVPFRACLNHPAVHTDQSCGRCGRPFCGDCLVPIRGQALCGGCKLLMLRDMQRQSTVRDRRADEALSMAAIGVLICGPVLEPLALARAITALQRHRGEREWADRWKAITAVVVASLYLLVILLTFGSILIYSLVR